MAHTYDSRGNQHLVLLVDDEAILRRLLRRMLAEAGFGVLEAEDGAAALRKSELLDGDLSLVITDLHMPVMGGVEFARFLRIQHPTVPVLFITGRDTDSLDPLDITGRLLRKPFGIDAFLAAVNGLLSPRN